MFQFAKIIFGGHRNAEVNVSHAVNRHLYQLSATSNIIYGESLRKTVFTFFAECDSANNSYLSVEK